MNYDLAKALFDKGAFVEGTHILGNYIAKSFDNMTDTVYHDLLIIVDAKDNGSDVVFTALDKNTGGYRVVYSRTVSQIDGMDPGRLGSCYGVPTSITKIPQNIERLHSSILPCW